MTKVFVNIGLSLDGYMAPEGMTIENWEKPEYKNWGAKWGELMAWIINQQYIRENLKLGPGGETGPVNDMVRNTTERIGANPNIELIITMDIEMTATVEYADFALAANSWAEFETYEITASCSNPFLQMWKGGIPPLYDTRDDARILAEVAAAIGDEIGEPRLRDYWKFIHEGRPEVYIQRLLDSSLTTTGYRFEDIASGKYGEPGAALMLFRTYPRIPFWEQVNDSVPWYRYNHRRCGRASHRCQSECHSCNFLLPVDCEVGLWLSV